MVKSDRNRAKLSFVCGGGYENATRANEETPETAETVKSGSTPARTQLRLLGVFAAAGCGSGVLLRVLVVAACWLVV